jgi:hypothetical protein
VNAIHSEDWCATIVAAVRGYYEAEDGAIDKTVAVRARNYHIIDGNIYRKGVCAPLLKCISVTEGKQLLHEIHIGMCSHHLGTRALVKKRFIKVFTGLRPWQMDMISYDSAQNVSAMRHTVSLPPTRYS